MFSTLFDPVEPLPPDQFQFLKQGTEELYPLLEFLILSLHYPSKLIGICLFEYLATWLLDVDLQINGILQT